MERRCERALSSSALLLLLGAAKATEEEAAEPALTAALLRIFGGHFLLELLFLCSQVIEQLLARGAGGAWVPDER